MRTPALLRRFPVPRRTLRSDPILGADVADRYPELAADIAFADAVVAPAFTECDTAALRQQTGYRFQQVVIIAGAAVLSGFGGLQAALPDARWPGFVIIVLGFVLAFVSRTADDLQSLEGFLTERVKAERLRSAYFRFLSRTGRYTGDDRRVRLERAVLQIKSGEEPE